MKPYNLYAEKEYFELTAEQKKDCCNGAGPRGFGLIVPDTLWFLNCSDCFDIHDFGFSEKYRTIPTGGWSDEDFHKQNRILCNNLYRKIEASTNFNWLKRLRRRRANVYVKAVESRIGALVYWNNKN